MSAPVTRRRDLVLVRAVALAVAASAAIGLAVTAPTASPASGAESSELTIRWTGDSSTAARFQPERSTTTPHFAEFDELSVTVSQTADLGDQAVRVTVDGFAPTRDGLSDFGANGQNFVQAMQCWGPDPLASDFRETCQWGGRYTANNGLGNSIYIDNTMRVAARDMPASAQNAVDVPFRAIDGREFSGRQVLRDPDGGGPLPETPTYALLDLIGPSTTNEVTSARIGADGSGFFDFETQTADQAPHLGCGTEDAQRCWLVIVPRGTVFGGDGEACSSYIDSRNDYEPYRLHQRNALQGGSPLNPACDYWDNRMVVPLDFRPVGSSCELGAEEQRVIGSELMVAAMSSWQPDLCTALGTTFNFATNADTLARARLLEGQATLAYTGFPLAPGELGTDEERDLLARTDVEYAPVAVSAVVVAFYAELPDGRLEELVLSPRLIAKLLTQSYRFSVPSNSSDNVKSFAHLPTANQAIRYLNADPEFRALNPDTWASFSENPAIILPGPGGADAIRQLWRWIQSDADAAAFLSGEPDEWGMSINPYYLPAGHPNAIVPAFDEAGEPVMIAGVQSRRAVGLANIDGSPLSLATAPIDTFLKADGTQVPFTLTIERRRFDSLQFAPYVDGMLAGARAAFRADPNSRTVWNPTALNAAGEVGDWVSSGAQAPGQKFTIAITDAPSAARYGLSIAAVREADDTAPVRPTAAAMAAALAALAPTALDTVEQVDPAQAGPGSYPLTVVTHAAVNLSETEAEERQTLAAMLERVTTAGQTPGSGIGELPTGYLPLTEELASLAKIAATNIASYLPGGSVDNGPAQDDYEGPAFFSDAPAEGEPGSGGPSEPAPLTDAEQVLSAGPEAEPAARSALAVALVGGLAGALAAPALLRGRRS